MQGISEIRLCRPVISTIKANSLLPTDRGREWIIAANNWVMSANKRAPVYGHGL